MSSEKQPPQSERRGQAAPAPGIGAAPIRKSGIILAGYDLTNSSPPIQAKAGSRSDRPIIFVIDHDHGVRNRIRQILVQSGWTVEDFEKTEDYLNAHHLHQLDETRRWLPAIVLTGKSDMSLAIQVIGAGASDFISKPIKRDELLLCVERAFDWSRERFKPPNWEEFPVNHTSGLTPRQIQILEMVLAGHPSKNIAAYLGISQRTVEKHRASIMKRTGVKSLPALTRLALTMFRNTKHSSARDK